jgi:hypothetical protein
LGRGGREGNLSPQYAVRGTNIRLCAIPQRSAAVTDSSAVIRNLGTQPAAVRIYCLAAPSLTARGGPHKRHVEGHTRSRAIRIENRRAFLFSTCCCVCASDPDTNKTLAPNQPAVRCLELRLSAPVSTI